ncbi:MAG TPA: ATP-binding protein [Bacilli bacterium]
MNKIRIRLTLIFIMMIGFSLIAAGLYMAGLMKDSHLNALREGMVREARIILVTMDWRTDGPEEELVTYFNTKAKNLRDPSNTRITFIREDGKVLGDSAAEPGNMDNHAEREEIKRARVEGVGYSIRHSNSINSNLLYAAVPVREDNDLVGFLRLAVSLEAVEASTNKLWSGLIISLIVLLAAAGAVSYRMAYGLTRPLEQIAGVAYQITHMNYKSRVHLHRKDEIGQLGLAINTMADSLQFQMNRIQEEESRLKNVLDNMINGVLMIDSGSRIVLMNRSAEDLLGFSFKELQGKKFDEAKQQYEFSHIIQQCIEQKQHIREEVTFYFPEERTLEINLVPIFHADGDWTGIVIVLHDISAIRRLERMRSEFVANVSHELRTPIAAVKGFAETLLAGAIDDKEVATPFLQIIYDESDRLNRLIGDILELSKIESKRVPLYFSPIHMQSFVNKTIEMMSAEASNRKISLDAQVEGDIYMEGDEDRLRQIFINLLANGINYTPEGGSIRVKVEAVDKVSGIETEDNDDWIRIKIKDTGIGIPKKDLPRIFERFYRVDKARSRVSGGTGLGLSIVKHLVELHHGSIRVESQVGSGTSFIIELPVIYK